VEDLFDSSRDRWQKSFRYPLYLRLLWIVGVAIVVAAIVWRGRIREVIASDARIGWAVVGGIVILALGCIWASVRSWETKILISPTAIKAWYIFRGRERISWDHMEKVVCRWGLPGHTLVLIGTDGARVRVRSSISRYDELVDHIRTNAPKHIGTQLDEIFGEEVVDEGEEELTPQPPPAGQEHDEDEQERKDEASP